MKNILIILIACVWFFSCTSRPEVIMRNKIADVVDTHTFTDFKVYETITLEDEIQFQEKLHNYYLNWHRSWHDAYSETADSTDNTKAVEYSIAIEKDNAMLEHLNHIRNTSNINETTFTTYRMTYMYVNDNGEKSMDFCYGKFNKDGDMVAFKSSSTSKWEVLGKTVSIKDYDIYKSSL